MLIEEIGLRNFQSFGNIRQSIKLNTNKGELILLVGRNGSGKTTIMNSMDFSLFKKVKGKYKKTQTLSHLANRINKELVNDITFISNNNRYYIERGINPNYVRLQENNNPPNDKAGADNIEASIANIIGLDFDTYKSFISMSINDFKNFISLSNEDKKLLLDKMFNLEYLNKLNDVLKTIISDNKKSILLYNKEIETLDDSIYEITQSIESTESKLLDKANVDYKSALEDLKTLFTDTKSKLDENQSKLTVAKTKYTSIKTKIDNIRTSYIETTQSIKNLQDKLKLYNSNKCPTCESDLSNDFHLELKNNLIEQVKTLTDIKSNLDIENTKVKTVEQKATTFINKMNELHYKLTAEINNIKSQRNDIIANQKNISDQVLNNTALDDFKKTINNLTSKKNSILNLKLEEDSRAIYHKTLSNILGENGVKRIIIRNIILPLNTFLSASIQTLKLPFLVELTENFDTIISHLGEEIPSETLSTGEMRKVNLCIMTSYLKFIRTKININVLFLDEIFSSIDIESINDVIELMRDFANEYNINIFIVHHSNLPQANFDRVIKVHKDIFTFIEEVNLNI